MIAVGSMNYWWPDLPAIIPGIIVVLFLMLANLISVKAFGELEFGFRSSNHNDHFDDHCRSWGNLIWIW